MKKAYTLLEIIIVIVILTLFIGAFQYFSPNKDKAQKEFWTQCTNYIYQEIETEINNLKKNKTEYWSWIIYSPISKIIERKHLNNTLSIITKYNNQWTIEQQEKYYTKDSICNYDKIINIKQYLIQITNEWGVEIDQSWDFTIQNDSWFQIDSCINTWDQNTCIPISKILFNKAWQTINQKFCLDFSWSICNTWQQ